MVREKMLNIGKFHYHVSNCNSITVPYAGGGAAAVGYITTPVERSIFYYNGLQYFPKYNVLMFDPNDC